MIQRGPDCVDAATLSLLRRIGLSDEQVKALDFNIAAPAGAQSGPGMTLR
jgi:hypothetical protein